MVNLRIIPRWNSEIIEAAVTREPSANNQYRSVTHRKADLMTEKSDITKHVRERYAAAAFQLTDVSDTSSASCCVPTDLGNGDVFGSVLYTGGESAEIPEQAFLASLGCGNPTAVAELRIGETVLDLGSGGGIDVLLSARRAAPPVSPTAST